MAITQRKYDFIIGGSGCAGLSLAWHLLQRKELRDKNIALIDGLDRPANDKTWCFWSTDFVPTPVPVHKSWKQLEVFAGSHHEITALPQALQYHCVRSEDYTQAMLQNLSQYHQLDIIREDVSGYQDEVSKGVSVMAGGRRYKAGHFFKCYGAANTSKARFSLLQHFKGREIITEHDFFDTRTARLMDFRVEQQNGPTFVYVLPYSPRHALIEYTLFSPELLSSQQYDAALDRYLEEFLKLSKGDWKTGREEFGIIPMADQLYQAGESANITYMGTAAGLPKASTGYTFSRIHRRSAAVAASLAERSRVKIGQPSAWRFRSYDIMLLDILKQPPEQYLAVFEALFKNNDLSRVLRFIDEQTSAYEDVKVMASVPWLPFLSAGARNADLILKGA
jgi:lycopene beta-cyclase